MSNEAPPNPDPETNPYLVERPKYRDPEWIREKYHGEGLSLNEVAQLTSTTYHTIVNEMDRHGIERRLAGRDLSIAKGIDKKLYSEEWLYEQYWELGKSTNMIAEELGVHQRTVHSHIRSFGIRTRSVGEAQRARFARERGEWENPHDE